MKVRTVRAVALGILLIGLVACSTTAVPTGQNAPIATTASKFHANTACPSGGIIFSPGGNGTYSVAVGHDCKVKGPPDTGCGPSSDPGTKHIFTLGTSASHGTLSGTSQNGTYSVATFTRTSPGDVIITLVVDTTELIGSVCHQRGGSNYGFVTLD
jgi:hypothetical protein